ncbi:hypothetical protein P43SY_005461 [Pythium insidiosum]|uniref:Golgin subfamily A member 7/ERF4 domain-containing protein n=1 Tax=Pythium insidiosum TaxID=114742 RepID=A0AAD5MAL2_PYTIN|nr:hypothetical protein P43SY_005461 [Pythium insidiosum]
MMMEPPAEKAPSSSTRGRRVLATLAPTGEIFVNGLASSYDDDWASHPQLERFMTCDEFQRAVAKINDALLDHWPCLPCTSFAYGCCVCTLGLSLYCASAQVREAEERTQLQLRRLNAQQCFASRQIEWRLVRAWYRRRSHIEISVADGAPEPTLPTQEEATARAPTNESMEARGPVVST